MGNLKTCIDKAFEKNDDSLKDFFLLVSNNLTDTETALKKTRNQLVYFVIVYFIIIKSSIGSITIGELNIKNLDIIIKIFPILISFKFYESMGLQSFRQLLVMSHYYLTKKLYPNLVANNLEALTRPESILSTSEFYETRDIGIKSSYVDNLGITILFIQLLILPLLFIIFSIYLNFSRFGFYDILNWVVLIIVIVLLLQTIFLFIQLSNHDHGKK